MDYNAINTAISKAYYKDARISVSYFEDMILAVTTDGIVMWFIPNKEFLFDREKITRGKDSLDVKRLVDLNGYKDAVKTEKLVVRDKKTLVIFESGDIEVFVDTKLLKTFDKTATFKVKSCKSPVFVYEENKLVGLIMPTRPPRKED